MFLLWFLFPEYQLLYCFQTGQDMCNDNHFTSHFDVCIPAAGRQVQEAAKYSEREERSLTGIPYTEDRTIKKGTRWNRELNFHCIWTICFTGWSSSIYKVKLRKDALLLYKKRSFLNFPQSIISPLYRRECISLSRTASFSAFWQERKKSFHGRS